MLVICSNCKTRLQLDENKIPPHAFKVRCPKCHDRIDIKSAAQNGDSGGLSLPADMTPPAVQISPFERPPSAAPFKPAASAAKEEEPELANPNDMARLLAQLLRQKETDSVKASPAQRPSWDHRKALVCTDSSRNTEVANGLVENKYEVFVAQNLAEALGRMREDRIDVLVLDADFDSSEQGFAFVMREIKSMRPSERRRLFLVLVTPNARTMDLYAAFLHNVNLVANQSEIERLPEALEVSLRYYNDLYRDVNRVLELAPI